MNPATRSDRNVGEGGSNISIVSEFTVGSKFDGLPPETIRMAKSCLLDFLGVAAASRTLPAFKSGSGLLTALGDSEEATVIGFKKRAPLLSAVWANSLLGSVMDLEDGYYPSIGHPASVVFPVTLAIADRERADGREFLTAVIIGYEVCARSGALMTRFYRKRPLGSGGSSVYGAAASASRLLKLDREKTETALGIAGCYMPTTPVHRTIQYETMIKGGIPWGTFVGASAAILAGRGFNAPPPTLQDPFRPEDDESARPVLESLGKSYEILKVYFKRYPSCRWTHAALDATMSILDEGHIAPEGIESIVVETFEEATRLANYRPSTLEGLQFSIPYTVAIAVAEGRFGVEQMSVEYLHNPAIQRLADLVEIRADPDLEAMFPKRRPARVTIATTDGSLYSRQVVEVHGEPGSDFATEGVREKFFGLAGARFGEERAREIYGMVDKLEELPSLEPLMELLRD